MKLVFKHEAPIAGNASVTETYELTQEELLPMIRRDRALRAAAEHRDEEELEFRAPQCILQELWNAEERVAHSCHRSDRVGGSAWSYEEIAGINREPKSIRYLRKSCSSNTRRHKNGSKPFAGFLKLCGRFPMDSGKLWKMCTSATYPNPM